VTDRGDSASSWGPRHSYEQLVLPSGPTGPAGQPTTIIPGSARSRGSRVKQDGRRQLLSQVTENEVPPVPSALVAALVVFPFFVVMLT
jgi:hypothetical protein